MSRRDPREVRYSNSNQLSDSVAGVFDGIAKLLVTVGGGAAIIGLGMLLYQFFGTGGAAPDQIQQALGIQDIFRQLALYGTLVASLGAAWMFWGEEVTGPIMIVVGLLLAFMTAWVPMVMPNVQANELQGNALNYLSMAGYPAVIVGLILFLADMAGRMKNRLREGAKADQMKYGKGMREERDTRNVFMGKCWQLPYCRKFVRERCPIYHARRTCWKERVGCMCEESVIKTAMEGGSVIPKDLVSAAKFIPKNHTLSQAAKAERCRQCVIYNEHQKHKYKLLLPITLVSVGATYLAMRPVLADSIQGALRSIDNIYKTATITTNSDLNSAAQATSIDGGSIPYNEIILFVLTLVLLAYTIKFVEYLIWKIKV